MDDVTLPRSFEDTTPAEMLKDFPRQRSSQSRSPILQASRQPSNYQSISPTTSNTQRNQSRSEPAHESDNRDQEEPHDESPSQPWFGKRIWRAFREWEQDNLELILENKQSVARDHLGIADRRQGSDYSERADVFSVVTNILVVCVYWGGNHAIISSVYYDTAWKSTKRVCRAPSTRSATWCGFCWNSRAGISAWSASV
jgi:hypothetical protein